MEVETLYIQIATIEDHNLVDTVESAFATASNPSRVYVGVAATAGQKFFDDCTALLAPLENVRIKRYDPVKDRGLGRGRVHSRFAYAGQDYVLQIDAHTLFEHGWDDFLIDLHKRAVVETGNPKTLVTGYLGPYTVENGKAVPTSHHSGYSVWSTQDVSPIIPLRNIVVTKIVDFPDHILSDKSREFYPSNRVAGNFIFGDIEWAKFHGWSGNETFWEEEVTPAITLLDNGFSLVFPNMNLPLTHRYYGDDLTRQLMNDIFEDQSDIPRLANEYLRNFVDNNQDACNKYREYSGYDLATNSLTLKVFIPNSYKF